MNLFDLSAKLTLDSSGFSKGISTAKSAVSTFGKAATATFAAGTAAFTAFAVDAVKVGADFDEAMSQVAATMGVTTDEIQNLREFAKEMGASTKFSATESAQALNYMALAGYDAEKSMEMLPTVLNLAAAGGMQLANASDMVTDAESALGLTSEETAAMVDQMAKAASKSNTSVSQLGDAILTIGGTAQFMAGGTDRLQTVLGLLADNGIKGSEAGTHLRNMLLKLSSPTEDGALAMEELGLNVFDSSGNMRDMQDIIRDLNKAFDGMTDEKRIDYISKLFNSRDIAAVNALLGTSEERWNELGAAIADAGGAAQQMAETQLDNLTGDITIMKSAWEGVRIEFSEGLMPVLRNIVQKVTGWLSNPKTMQFIKDLGEKTGALVEKIVNWLEKVIPYVIDAVKSLWPVFKEVFGNVSEVVGKVAGYALDAFKKVLPKISDMIKKAIALVQKIAPPVTKFVKSLMPSLKSIVQTLTKIGKSVLPVVVNLVKKLAPVIKTVIELVARIVKTIGPTLAQIVKVLGKILGDIIDDIGAFMKSWGDAIIKFLKMVVEFIKPLISALEKVWDITRKLISPVKELINFVGIKLGGSMETASEKIEDVAEDLGDVAEAASDVSGIDLSAFASEMGELESTSSRLSEIYDSLHGSIRDTALEADADAGKIAVLWDELSKLVDEKGQVNDADAERARFITDELEGLTGKEFEWNGNVLQGYKDISAEIVNIIKKRKAMALLEPAEEASRTAEAALSEVGEDGLTLAQRIEKNEKLLKGYAHLRETLTRKILQGYDDEIEGEKEWYESTKEAYDYWAEAYQKRLNGEEIEMGLTLDQVKNFRDNLAEELSGFTADMRADLSEVDNMYTDLEQRLDEDKAAYELYYDAIADYNGAYRALIQGDYDTVLQVLDQTDAARLKSYALNKDITDQQLSEIKLATKNAIDVYNRYNEEYLSGQYDRTEEGLAQAKREADEMIKIYELAVVRGNESLLEEARGLGVSFVNGFSAGIKSMAQAAAQRAKEMAQGAVDVVKRTLEIASPSKVTTQIGKYFGEGFEDGIIDEVGAVRDAVGYMSDSALDAFGNPISGGGATGAGGQSRVEMLLEQILANMGVDIVLDDGTIAGRVDRIIGQSAMRKARGGA